MQRLVRYVGIDSRTQECAEHLWRVIEPSSEEVIGSIYKGMERPLGPAFDEAALGRLREAQKEHWRALFNDKFDLSYQRSATLLAIKHQDIGLHPKWCIAGYALTKMRFADSVLRALLPAETKERFMTTLDKYVAVDMAVSFSTYSSWLVD